MGRRLTVLMALVLTGTAQAAQRPGPELLYAPPPRAPQLENTGPWKARPILISGAESYRRGEFVYQDFLFDDHGATGPADDPADPFNQVENMFSAKHGTLSYPTDTKTFANNAADLVEFRVKPLRRATAFRVTLNTLVDPERTAFTIALGNSAHQVAWPLGAGVRSPARVFVTVHGAHAEVSGGGTARVRVDKARRQFDVRLPHAVFNPRRSTVRMSAGVGLWDVAGGHYLAPGPTATATRPGGVSASGAALFNVAFRTSEPVPHINYPGIANSIVEGHVGVVQDGAYWRERQQGDRLASGDISQFAAHVDFGKLARRVRDDSQVPRTGHIDRIFPSRFAFGQGVDYGRKCLTSPGGECTGRYVGQLQTYGLYVPRKPVPRRGFGLVVSMHGLSGNHNEFLGSNEAEQLGERGNGSLVASPEGRGPDGGYDGYAEADVFEMWNDLRRHYRLDAGMTDITGYSMGGLGTWRLAGRWPDLFARAFPIVGPGVTPAFDQSLRNVPVMSWNGQNDELANPALVEAGFAVALAAGIRYDHWVFAPAGHITLGNNDEYGPAAAFFGAHRVVRNPPHISYVVSPGEDSKAVFRADHAYWLSGLALAEGAGTGTVDARSHGFGSGDPPVLAPAASAGTLNGGSHGPLPYTRRTIAWGPAPKEPVADVLDLTTAGLSAVTVDVRRARLSCHPKINLDSDVPVRVTLAGCPGT